MRVRVDVAVVGQGRLREDGGQGLGERFDEGLGVAVLCEIFKERRVGLFPIGKKFGGGVVERGEFRMAEDDRFHVGAGQLAAAGVRGLLEQGGAHGGDDLPHCNKHVGDGIYIAAQDDFEVTGVTVTATK